jgi:hypothetical protein
MRGGLVNDHTFARVIEDTGSTIVAEYAKGALGLSGTGGTGGDFVTLSLDLITPSLSGGTGSGIIGVGPFHLEFDFDSVIAEPTGTLECWYIDDIEVQVIP